MDGYKVTIYRITPKDPAASGYSNETSEEIYDQKVPELDVQAVIAVVNKLTKAA